MHVAASDCERIRPGRIAQPVNTVSSLAYCASGAWLLRPGARTRDGVPLGLAAIAAGLGSAAYHGPGGRASRLAHDLAAVSFAGAITVVLLRGRASVTRRSASVGCLTAGVAVHAASRTGRACCRPDSRWQGHALWHLLGAAAAVLAAGREPATARSRRRGASTFPPRRLECSRHVCFDASDEGEAWC